MDALDAYMSAIKSGAMDTKTKMKLKRQLLELRKEEQKLQRMVNVAKPAALPDIKRCVFSINVKYYRDFRKKIFSLQLNLIYFYY